MGPSSKEVGLLLNKELLGFLFLNRGETQRRWIDLSKNALGNGSKESKGQKVLANQGLCIFT